MGRAVLSGLVTTGQPFLRTPKCEAANSVVVAVRGVGSEMLFLLSLLLAALAIILGTGRMTRRKRPGWRHWRNVHALCRDAGGGTALRPAPDSATDMSSGLIPVGKAGPPDVDVAA